MPSSIPFITIVSCFLPLLLIFIWFKRKHRYWLDHNIPYIPPTAFLGNLKDLLLLRTTFGEAFQAFYAKGTASVVGIYVLHKPALLLRDPKLISAIFVKHAEVFQNRFEAADEHGDRIGALMLPLAKHDVWYHSRRRMAQLFTSASRKGQMYEKMLTVAEDLEQFLQHRCSTLQSSAIIEVKEMFALYTIDITGLLMYSLPASSLKQGDSKLREVSREVLRPTFMRALQFFVIFFLPHLVGLFRAKVFTSKYIRFMRQLVRRSRQQFVEEAQPADLLELLFAYQASSNAKSLHEPDFVVAQASIFLLAGFETSASLLALTLYELAKQPALQQQLRQELSRSLSSSSKEGQLTFEQLKSLPYLNMIVAEALRLYPTAAFINREYTPPPHNSSAAFSLRPFADFDVPKGMPLYVSILGLHRDERYWPNPLHFDPTRFAAANMPAIQPGTYIPFGCGPHSCVGSRLGLLQVKLALFTIFRRYTVATCARTVESIQFDPKSFMLHAKGDIYLEFTWNDLTDEL